MSLQRASRPTLRFARPALAALAALLLAGAQRGAAPVQWTPQLSPSGPVVVVVSLPLQRANVYRNGVRIGSSPVSTGKPGHETPTGVFTILQKKVEHTSNLYNDAPMPYMQRLTWDGIALHAGRLPGYPASHGCIRLPDGFARSLFGITRAGDVVIVADRASVPSTAAAPGLLAPAVAVDTGANAIAPVEWAPQRAPAGPLTVVVSTRDRRVVALRNGTRIGSAPLRMDPPLVAGTRAWVLLEGRGEGMSRAVPDRPARRWMALPVSGTAADDAALVRALDEGRLAFPGDFARAVYDVLRPGTTVIVTDEPLATGPVEPLLIEGERAPGR